MPEQMTLRQAAEMALERLESHEYWMDERAIKALRQALAQPEQEPVAWMLGDNFYTVKQCNLFGQDKGKEKPNQIPLYTAPPKREWVGLTEDEINNTRVRWTMINGPGDYLLPFARAIEAKLKEKNT